MKTRGTKPKDGLTPKQRLFVDSYLRDMNATHAAKEAGYSPRSAHVAGARQIKKANVRKAIDDAVMARAARTTVDNDWVVRNFVANHDRAVASGDLTNANRALEALGKHVGAFKTKVEISGPDGGPIRTESKLSPEERRARIDQLIAAKRG